MPYTAPADIQAALNDLHEALGTKQEAGLSFGEKVSKVSTSGAVFFHDAIELFPVFSFATVSYTCGVAFHAVFAACLFFGDPSPPSSKRASPTCRGPHTSRRRPPSPYLPKPRRASPPALYLFRRRRGGHDCSPIPTLPVPLGDCFALVRTSSSSSAPCTSPRPGQPRGGPGGPSRPGRPACPHATVAFSNGGYKYPGDDDSDDDGEWLVRRSVAAVAAAFAFIVPVVI